MKTSICPDTLKRIKRQVVDWDKGFAIHKSHKGFLSRIYKQHFKFNFFKKETGYPINEQKGWTTTLQNDIKMADIYILKLLKIIRNMRNKKF